MSSGSMPTPSSRREEKRMDAFLQFMHRLDQTVIGDDEVKQAALIARKHIEPIRIIDDPPSSDMLMDEEFREKIMGTIYPKAEDGLKANGWSEFGSRSLGSGSFGAVHLGYRARHQNRNFEDRLLCAIKVISSAENDEETWDLVADEIAYMRCLSHPHVVGYYCNFRVQESGGRVERTPSFKQEASQRRLEPSPKKTFEQLCDEFDRRRSGSGSTPEKSRSRTRTPSPQSRAIAASTPRTPRYRTVPKGPTLMYICMEFANAGNLRAEIFRYHAHRIPEAGARYYGLQLVEALVYIHSRGIMHNDLHPKNVLMKYEPDGRTKKAMICDFGRSYLIEDPDESTAEDVGRLFTVIRTMMIGYRNVPKDAALLKQGYNNSAIQFIRRWSKQNIDPNWRATDLLADPWFKIGSKAPIPDKPDDGSGVPRTRYVDPPIHPAHLVAEVPPGRAVRSVSPGLPALAEGAVPGPSDSFHQPITPSKSTGRFVQGAGLRAWQPNETYPYEKRQLTDPRDPPAEVPIIQRKARNAKGEPIYVTEAVSPDSDSDGGNRRPRGSSAVTEQEYYGAGRGRAAGGKDRSHSY
jgi:tRNA A-37 threonylcarbamoyl transferase component Bud32